MLQGSSYENYDKAHADYDRTRLAVGSEQIIGFIRRKFPDTKALHTKALRLLDAGCGTGAHLHAFQKAGFCLLTGIDISATGLSQAAQKLGLDGIDFSAPMCRNSQSVEPQNGQAVEQKKALVCGDIREMPFSVNSFDVILFSFVLHHLPHTNQAELEMATEAVLKHAAALLSPGGLVIIITCSATQLSASHGCMWYYRYFPEAAAKLANRFLNPKKMCQLLLNAGLTEAQMEVVERTYWTDASLDPYGPTQLSWQNGDSLFALCKQDPELFEKQLAALRQDIASGAVYAHIEETKNRTDRVKQATIVLAAKA